MKGLFLFVTTACALVAFALNSILCRLALGGHAIDAASFTTLRLGSGALTLAVIQRASRGRRAPRTGWLAAGLLFAYAICFSFAYDTLSTGVGALLLFGSVQVSMLVVALRAGERLTIGAWFGFAVAASGLVVLVLPGLSAPHPVGAGLMVMAGVAWGGYTLKGRGSTAPVADTARSFLLAAPLALVASALTMNRAYTNSYGVYLALTSGALTSGVGYAVWYAVLPRLSTARAAALQLLVPVIAAAGGVVLVSEPITLRLVLSSCMILGGVGAVVLARAVRMRAT